MLYTTFALAHKAGACHDSYKKMANALDGINNYGADTPVPLTEIVKVCGLRDALWTLQCTTEDSDKIARIFACDCAWRVLPNYESKYPGDMRVRNCIETTRKLLLGEATKDELSAAESAAELAAESAALAAVRSAWSAVRSAWSAVRSAWSARSAELEWQTKHFIELLGAN
jgi:hypothetical protein